MDASFLSSRDPDLHATRRAGRAAIAVPVLLWVGKDALENPVLGTFAALGSIALLVFVDFGGSLGERAIAQATLVLASAVLVCLGTLASTSTWVATAATLLVAFVLLFAGVLSSLQRALAHLQPRSVRMHNSLRGGAAFALAVLVADLSNVQHGFWVVFGTLAVLRSNAASTGQDTLRALAGTTVGILLGGGLVALVGASSTVSWFLLAPAVALIALGPVAISFTAGQVGFTTTLLVLTNIIAPAGWSVGLVRLTDVAIGCGVSIVVGCLFWPRGAGRALGLSLADGFTASAQYVHAAVEYGISRCDSKAPSVDEPSHELDLAAAAGRRVDDAFRAYTVERGSKRMKLADLATLVGAISLLRLTGDAVLDLWDRDGSALGGEREAAGGELRELSVSVVGWYEQAGRALAGVGAIPPRLEQDATANGRLTGIVQRDLRGAGAEAASTAVKMIWTADHVEVARELQAEIVDPTTRAAALQSRA